MTNNKPILPLLSRLFSVWNRHFKVYTRNLYSNAFPAFIEPLIFLAGIGLGLAGYMKNGDVYITFLATGLLVVSSMFTSSFECTYGTFIRLEFDHVYDGMLAAPITWKDLLHGEMLWAASKGVFFASSVLIVFVFFGLINSFWSLFIPILGFLTALMFSTISLFITSFVKNINYFNFYFTGLLSPMFFFSGVIFPLSKLTGALRVVAEFLPLTHCVRMSRELCSGNFSQYFLFDFLYIVLVTLLFSFLAKKRLFRRLVD